MTAQLPPIVFDLISLLSSFLRMVGMLALGVTLGYLVVTLLREAQAWPLQIAVFLGLLGLIIAMMAFLPGTFSGFAIGFGVAIFLWGMPKKKKAEESQG